MVKIIVTIERPDGTTYEQEINYINDSIEQSVKAAQRFLGRGYWIVDVRKVKSYE